MLEGFFRSPRSIVWRTAPRSVGGTSSGFDSPAASLDELFKHPDWYSPIAPYARTLEFSSCHNRLSTACWCFPRKAKLAFCDHPW